MALYRTRKLGWNPLSFSILEPYELVGSVRSCQMDHCGQRLQVGQGSLGVQDRLVLRVRQAGQRFQGCRLFQVHRVDLGRRGCPVYHFDQVVQQVLFVQESNDHLLHEVQELRFDHCFQVSQVNREVLEVQENHHRQGDQNHQVLHQGLLVRVVRMDQAWPCIRIEVVLAITCPLFQHLFLALLYRHLCQVDHHLRLVHCHQLDQADLFGKYSKSQLLCELA